MQRLLAAHERHFVEAAVTGDAGNPFLDMNAVVEIDEVGKVMHPRPAQGTTRPKAFSDGSQRGTVAPDLAMALHTCLGGRNPGHARVFDARVTIAAINTQSTDMVGV